MESEAAKRVQDAAARIREKVKRTLQNLIEIGKDLQAIKNALPHGEFGRWLKMEFGWTDRTARNFLSVAQQFGKSETLSDLQIHPTAAYLLAAPSSPDVARQAALDRARAGEPITTAVAREILAQARKKRGNKPKRVPAAFLKQRLKKTLTWYQEHWSPKELSDLAHELREFADVLERSRKKRDKSMSAAS